jgi:hypothetical protein
MTASVKLSPSQMAIAWHESKRLGREAGETVIPQAMIVEGYENDPISDGACGFGWVNVSPGNSRFAKWLVRNEYARKDSYYGGVTVWIGEHRQSLTRKAAHASAMAAHLRTFGIEARGASRID